MLDLFRLDGRVALVTGCRRGIGRGMALALAEAGADIAGVSASLEPGSEVEQEVKALGRRFWGYACDLGNRQALYELMAKVKGEVGQVDILINNAGIIRRAPAAEHSDAYWDEVVRLNLDAQYILAREFGREMVARGRGKIVFTASVLSFQGGITVPGYAAAKGGIGTLTMALANEWAGKGVNVNAIAPGYIATDNNQALREDPVRSGQLMARIPAARWGQPDDLKGAVVFLCSDAAAYVHGAIVAVDGGWLGR
ncbi:MAG: SDR family NAD(P)-dependent oxidoreductase [Candidatus Handelsmanbacteria bacterium]|nr:SDR family NAD(P)-dependent oxidoreductase [Candidatus Handelsmanbacteria bacterium]